MDGTYSFIYSTQTNIQNLGVNASTDRGFGDLGVDGRNELSWHTSVNTVAGHGFDSRKEQGFFFLVTSESGVLSDPEAVERSQRIFSWIKSNESCRKARSCKTTVHFQG